ncbi:hypothetical protein CTI12_AA277920 [Artemisia annua]|uniref:Uncharacterized protein n=1 Tax=Artemisia annua TaxID=35608 RepID=A0A2U1NE91_ARTAN|nr:hypothetical protein CTI12_AA277920 [Artemisia annua]
MNRSFNVIPPAVGTKSAARIIDTRRREGKEVTAIYGFEIAHYCEKKNKMVNEEAEAVLKKLRSEEAAGSGTPVEICLKVLKHVPGHLRGCSAPKKEILAVENLRTTVELEKKKLAALEEEVQVLKEEQVKHQKEQASFKVEQYEMKKNMDLMMQEIKRLSGLVSQNSVS